MLKSHKELFVWQKSVELTVYIYNLTDQFPKNEIFGLTSQMRRASVSIPSNIAEGRSRNTRKDFIQFLKIAQGSCSELETQLEISRKLSFGKNLDYNKIDNLLTEIQKMLSSMVFKLKA